MLVWLWFSQQVATRMGMRVNKVVAARYLGKTILELGGNNAIIITPNADLKVMLTSAVWGSWYSWTALYNNKTFDCSRVRFMIK